MGRGGSVRLPRQSLPGGTDSDCKPLMETCKIFISKLTHKQAYKLFLKKSLRGPLRLRQITKGSCGADAPIMEQQGLTGILGGPQRKPPLEGSTDSSRGSALERPRPLSSRGGYTPSTPGKQACSSRPTKPRSGATPLTTEKGASDLIKGFRSLQQHS